MFKVMLRLLLLSLFLLSCDSGESETNERSINPINPVESELEIRAGRALSCLIDSGELARDGSICLYINAVADISTTESAACSEFIGLDVGSLAKNENCPVLGRVENYGCFIEVLPKHRELIKNRKLEFVLYNQDLREARRNCANLAVRVRRGRILNP